MRKIGVYFLNLDYGEKLTGIEISSLKRAQIFDEFLNYDIKLLSLKYRRTLDKCRSMYLDSYRLSNKVNFANLYGDFQHSENRKISKHVSESIWSAAQEPNQENVVKVINENKEVIKYIVYDEKDKQKINYINNFIHGKKYMKELFDEYGTLSSKQYFDDTQK